MPKLLLPFLSQLPTPLRCLRPSRLVWLLTFLLLSAFAARAQAPANDDPCGAISLTLNGNLCIAPTVGTNVGATTTAVNGVVSNTCGSFNNTTPKDVWYKFTTAATGQASAGATITVTGNPAGLLRLFSAASCTGTFTQVVCTSSNASNTAAPRLVTGALQPGTTYYVQVAGYTSTDTQGQFTICITDPPACGAPAVLGVTFPTGTSAAVSFAAGPGNTTFTAVLNGPTPQTIAPATSPVVFAGLTPGATYFVSIRTECGGSTVTSPFFSFTVPLLNDEPCGATVLPITTACTATTGTTFGASTTLPNGYSNPGCALDPSPLDVWYQFTTPASGGASTSATITVTGTPAGQVRLFAGASCNGPLTQLACSQSPTGPALPLTVTTLLPNTTYYVMVAGYSDSSPRGNFTICVTGAAACPDPTNLSIVSTSTTTADLSFTPSPSATSYNVSYAPQSGGTPVTLTASGSPVQLTGLVAGTTYNVTLQSVCPAGVGSVLTKTFTATSAAPANDECIAATPIGSVGIGTCGGLVMGTTTAATASVGAPNPGCANFVTADVWFSVVVPASGTLQLETAPVAGGRMTDSGLALYSGTCGNLTLLGCDDDSGTGSFSLLRRTGLTPGTTVYARVWPFANFPAGEFTICAQTDVQCPNVTNLALNNITSTSAALAFTPAVSGTSYTVTYTAQGGTVNVITPNPGSSPVLLQGLTPNTVYTVTIQTNCPAGQGLPLALTFTTLAPVPANDDCAAATVLPLSTTCTPVTSSTLGATASTGLAAPTCAAGTVNDVWFALTVPANGVVIVTTGGISGSAVIDTGLQLYSGSCGALIPVGCNDNFGAGSFSQVRAAGLTPGATVYARVWQMGGGNGGAFTVCATTDPACPAPTNLTVSGITTTAASLAFTPPAAGTSYTVTYTAPGSATLTVSPAPTASPVALTGLTPGTTYLVSVVSNCGGAQSSSASVSFTTLALPPCLAVTALTANSITSTSATLTFQPASTGLNYTVTYAAQGGTPVTITPNPDSSPITLTGLTPGTAYSVSVVSNCGSGQTSAPATVTFTTLPLPACPPVTNLTTSAITATTITVSFTPAGSSLGYTLSFGPPSVPPTTISVSSSPVSLTGLLPSTQYVICITNSCAGGTSSAPVCVNATTLALPAPCPAPTALTASAGATTATVSFLPSAAATSYTLTYTPAGGSPQTATAAGSPIALSNLMPNKTYSLSLVGACAGGTTSAALTGQFTTLVTGSSNATLAATVSLYPNPTQRTFWLSVPAALTRTAVRVTLYNSLGQRVLERELAPAATGIRTSFDVTPLPRGVYSVQLLTPSGPLTKRLAVE